MKRPLLLFSGGADSTLRLQQLLQFTSVDLVYGGGHIHPAKKEMELFSRQKIINYLELANAHGEYSVCRDFVSTERLTLPINDKHGLHQPIPWLMTALAFYHPDVHSHLEMCYLLSDDASLQWQNIRKAWKNMCRVAFADPNRSDDDYDVQFPLINYRKFNVYNQLDPKLRRLIWVCETPIEGEANSHKACGKCNACVTKRRGMSDARKYAPLPNTQVYEGKLA